MRSYSTINPNLYCFSIDTGTNLYVIHGYMVTCCCGWPLKFLSPIKAVQLYTNCEHWSFCFTNRNFLIDYLNSTNGNERSLTSTNLIYLSGIIFLIVASLLSLSFLFPAASSKLLRYFLIRRAPRLLVQRVWNKPKIRISVFYSGHSGHQMNWKLQYFLLLKNNDKCRAAWFVR